MQNRVRLGLALVSGPKLEDGWNSEDDELDSLFAETGFDLDDEDLGPIPEQDSDAPDENHAGGQPDADAGHQVHRRETTPEPGHRRRRAC